AIRFTDVFRFVADRRNTDVRIHRNICAYFITLCAPYSGLEYWGRNGYYYGLSDRAVTPPGRRGFYASFQYLTLVGGQILALGLLILLQKFLLTDAQLHEWGWRIPFAIGAVLTLGMIYLQRHLQETRAYQASRAKKTSSSPGVWKQLI